MTTYYELPDNINSHLKRLIISAENCSTWRKHRLDWTIYNDRVALGQCSCGAWVQVETNPMPNSIDIGGPAVAIDCPHGSK